MESIGKEEEAETILTHVREIGLEYLIPEGWERLGTGSYRSVWLSPSGVAYKVAHQRSYNTHQEVEVDALRRISGMEPPEGCRLPEFGVFRFEDETVVAMEAIKGVTLYDYRGDDRDRFWELLDDIRRAFKVCDMHDENAMVDQDGILVPVDFGL